MVSKEMIKPYKTSGYDTHGRARYTRNKKYKGRINYASIRDRKSKDYYGTSYSNLSNAQKSHINGKVRRLVNQGVTE